LKLPPRRILVVCLRRLGDLLLATPLVRSLRQAWPSATLEMMVYAGSEGVVAGNPDIDRVIVLPANGKGWVPALRSRFRHYDLALALQSSDRAHFVAWWCGRRSGGLLPPAGEPGRAWKRWLQSVRVEAVAEQHSVQRNLSIAVALGVSPVAEMVAPADPAGGFREALQELAVTGNFAVLHPRAMHRFKSWHEAGWRALIAALSERGLTCVISGGGAEAERTANRRLAEDVGPLPVVDASGRLNFAQLAALLRAARVFVGVDTVVTHLAAACGTPTVALFGPSDPVVWGPWPSGGEASPPSPWVRAEPLQQAGNVILLQGTHGRFGNCIPCLREGCEGYRDSVSDCLDQLQATRVEAAIDRLLAPPDGGS